MHVGGLIQVPRCSLIMSTPFMQLGTCNVLKYPNVKQSVQLHTFFQCLLDPAEVLRSLDHVL